MVMSIINKQFVTIDNDTYSLLGIDNKSQKYYIRCVDAVTKIRRTDFIFIIEDNRLIDAMSHNLYFNNLDKITSSTLTLKELSDLKDALDYITNLKRAFKLTKYSHHDIFAETSQLSEEVENKHKLDLMQYYPQINELLTEGD